MDMEITQRHQDTKFLLRHLFVPLRPCGKIP